MNIWPCNVLFIEEATTQQIQHKMETYQSEGQNSSLCQLADFHQDQKKH